MKIDHECLREPHTLLERAMLDDASTTLDTDSDSLLEWHA